MLLVEYIKKLKQDNKKINLFSKNEINKIETKHIFDALQAKQFISKKEKLKILDIGSGNGIPGIPIQIEFPNLDTWLIDSKRKKANKLKEFVDFLNINCRVINERVEDFSLTNKNVFDIVLMRAVGKISYYEKYIHSLLKKDGYFLAWKSTNYKEELNTKKLKLVDQYDYFLPTPEREFRTILKFVKL